MMVGQFFKLRASNSNLHRRALRTHTRIIQTTTTQLQPRPSNATLKWPDARLPRTPAPPTSPSTRKTPNVVPSTTPMNPPSAASCVRRSGHPRRSRGILALSQAWGCLLVELWLWEHGANWWFPRRWRRGSVGQGDEEVKEIWSDLIITVRRNVDVPTYSLRSCYYPSQLPFAPSTSGWPISISPASQTHGTTNHTKPRCMYIHAGIQYTIVPSNHTVLSPSKNC